MAQYFNDIQISDKGMIKLVSNSGEDYIFPARKITNFGGYQDYIEPEPMVLNMYEKSMLTQILEIGCAVLIHVVDAYRNRFSESLNEENLLPVKDYPFLLWVEVNDQKIYTNKLYDHELNNRLNEAKKYSLHWYADKFGYFS